MADSYKAKYQAAARQAGRTAADPSSYRAQREESANAQEAARKRKILAQNIKLSKDD